MKEKNKNIFLLAALLILLRLATGNTISFNGSFKAKNSFPEKVQCIKVIDGDTLIVKRGNEVRVVRLIGVDAPEKNEPLHDEAKRKLQEIVLNKTLILKKDVSEKDKYGRLLRYVYVKDKLVNTLIVKEGVATPQIMPPNLAEAKSILSATKIAQRNGRGLWKLSKD